MATSHCSRGHRICNFPKCDADDITMAEPQVHLLRCLFRLHASDQLTPPGQVSHDEAVLWIPEVDSQQEVPLQAQRWTWRGGNLSTFRSGLRAGGTSPPSEVDSARGEPLYPQRWTRVFTPLQFHRQPIGSTNWPRNYQRKPLTSESLGDGFGW